MRDMRPIEIIGGGLAGLSLGIALRHRDVPVDLHEAGMYPRHRVCGEFIAGLSRSTIDRLQLGEVLHDALMHREVAWFLPGQSSHVQHLPAPAWGLSRHTLDARLARKFTALGGNLQTQSRIVDEANKVGRVFALGRRRDPRSRWIGLKVHVNDLSLARELELHLGGKCYVGLARIENDRVNVCGLFQRRPISERGPKLLLQYLRAAGLDALVARIAGATIRPETFCAVAAVDFDRTVFAGGGIRLGDAGAMIPPFTGNGMAMAFQSAELALQPLLEYARGTLEWSAACSTIQEALRSQFRLRLASAGAVHPFLLQRRRQCWLARLGRARLLPMDALYAAMH